MSTVGRRCPTCGREITFSRAAVLIDPRRGTVWYCRRCLEQAEPQVVATVREVPRTWVPKVAW